MQNIAQYVLKTSFEQHTLTKEAAFPSMFLQLDQQSRNYISSRYSVGNNSEVTSIPITAATKKPYTEMLLVYTTSVLSSAEQDKAANELKTQLAEFQRSGEYSKLHGSQAGKEMLDQKTQEIQAEIDKKYAPKERPVAWGIGTQFNLNNSMFRYFRRGKSYGAPNNRKELIAYIERNGGKVYAISPDEKVQQIKQQRRENVPLEKQYTSPEVEQIKARAKAYAVEKLKEIDVLVEGWLQHQKAIALKEINESFDNALSELKQGKGASISTNVTFTNSMLNKISGAYKNAMDNSIIIWAANTVDDANKQLAGYVKQMNELVDKLKESMK